MKVLKFILYLIVFMGVIFFAFGLLMPKVEYGYEMTANKPLQEAWAVSHDESKFPLWLEGFKSMEHISGEKNTVGCKHKIIVNPGNGEEDFEMIETITSYEEFDHLSMHFDSDMMDFEQTIRVKEVDGGTTFTTESAVMAKGIMLKSFFAMMETLSGAFSKQEGKNMEALKTVIEENTTNYYPEPEIEEMEGVTDSLAVEEPA